MTIKRAVPSRRRDPDMANFIYKGEEKATRARAAEVKRETKASSGKWAVGRRYSGGTRS